MGHFFWKFSLYGLFLGNSVLFWTLRNMPNFFGREIFVIWAGLFEESCRVVDKSGEGRQSFNPWPNWTFFASLPPKLRSIMRWKRGAGGGGEWGGGGAKERIIGGVTAMCPCMYCPLFPGSYAPVSIIWMTKKRSTSSIIKEKLNVDWKTYERQFRWTKYWQCIKSIGPEQLRH